MRGQRACPRRRSWAPSSTKAGECDRSVTTIGSFFRSASAKRQIVSWKFNLEKFDSDVCTRIANALRKTVNCNCHGHRLKRKFFLRITQSPTTLTLTSINICTQTDLWRTEHPADWEIPEVTIGVSLSTGTSFTT
jgi:hypothetical protein